MPFIYNIKTDYHKCSFSSKIIYSCNTYNKITWYVDNITKFPMYVISLRKKKKPYDTTKTKNIHIWLPYTYNTYHQDNHSIRIRYVTERKPCISLGNAHLYGWLSELWGYIRVSMTSQMVNSAQFQSRSDRKDKYTLNI